MAQITAQFDHPAWLTAAGTLAGYGLVLLFMFLLLFVVPYLLFPACAEPVPLVSPAPKCYTIASAPAVDAAHRGIAVSK
jgi:Na+-transporting methylmalonyl-CoA/oxaloacetate decarboxylase gamma subunit